MSKKHSSRIPIPTLAKRRIPPGVAEYGGGDPESEPYVLSFKHYNDSQCQIDLLTGQIPAKTLHTIRLVGKSTRRTLYMENHIESIPVANAGEYKKLYNRLPPDTDLKEHKIQGTSRIFYFVAKNVFSIVAITMNHFETKKQFR